MFAYFGFVFLLVVLDLALTGGRTIRRPMSELVGWFILLVLAIKALRWVLA